MFLNPESSVLPEFNPSKPDFNLHFNPHPNPNRRRHKPSPTCSYRAPQLQLRRNCD